MNIVRGFEEQAIVPWGSTSTSVDWWGGSITYITTSVYIWFDPKFTTIFVASPEAQPKRFRQIWPQHVSVLRLTCYPTVLLYLLVSHFKSHWCAQLSLEPTFMMRLQVPFSSNRYSAVISIKWSWLHTHQYLDDGLRLDTFWQIFFQIFKNLLLLFLNDGV